MREVMCEDDVAAEAYEARMREQEMLQEERDHIKALAYCERAVKTTNVSTDTHTPKEFVAYMRAKEALKAKG